jgi:hypothetical protein
MVVMIPSGEARSICGRMPRAGREFVDFGAEEEEDPFALVDG